MRNTYNASTVTPYDAGEAQGDLSATNAKPGKTKGKCGVFGQILLVAIAVAVTIITAGSGSPVSAAIAAIGLKGVAATAAVGAVAGAAGSIASQTVGVITGIQEKFSFKGVAMAAIAGGIGGAFKGAADIAKAGGKLGSLGKALNGVSEIGGSVGESLGVGSTFGAGFAQSAVSSIATQGIGVATGLQDSFSWAGVAAAGVSGGVGAVLGDALQVDSLNSWKSVNPANVAKHLAVGAASSIASAATHSVIDSSSFGDNVVASIPDVVGNVLGGVVGACFTAETLVHTREGLRRIDEVKVGDWVWSRDEHFRSDRVELRQVIDLYRFEDRATLDVVVSFAGGAETRLRTTPEHPFAVVVGGDDAVETELEAGRVHGAGVATAARQRAAYAWRSAEDLVVGERVIDREGRVGLVTGLDRVEGLSTAHNFAVDGHHTYFVGEQGVWVHNEYKAENIITRLSRQIRGNARGQARDVVGAGYDLIKLAQQDPELYTQVIGLVEGDPYLRKGVQLGLISAADEILQAQLVLANGQEVSRVASPETDLAYAIAVEAATERRVNVRGSRQGQLYTQLNDNKLASLILATSYGSPGGEIVGNPALALNFLDNAIIDPALSGSSMKTSSEELTRLRRVRDGRVLSNLWGHHWCSGLTRIRCGRFLDWDRRCCG